jgi:hypothetical protein
MMRESAARRAIVHTIKQQGMAKKKDRQISHDIFLKGINIVILLIELIRVRGPSRSL